MWPLASSLTGSVSNVLLKVKLFKACLQKILSEPVRVSSFFFFEEVSFSRFILITYLYFMARVNKALLEH